MNTSKSHMEKFTFNGDIETLGSVGGTNCTTSIVQNKYGDATPVKQQVFLKNINMTLGHGGHPITMTDTWTWRTSYNYD